MASARAGKALLVAAAKNGQATSCDVDATAFLLAHPRGAYTAARTVQQTRVFDYEAHIQRLVKSTLAMQLDGATRAAQTSEAVEQALRPRAEATLAAAMQHFKAQFGLQPDEEYKINVLVCKSEGAGKPSGHADDCKVLDGADVYCHIGLLPALRSERVKLEVTGLPRHNAAAKDSAWVRERKVIYDHMAPDVEEIILMDPQTHRLLEGSQTNFYAIQDGTVFTAEDGILKGTVRSLVLEVCAENGIPVKLSPPSLDDVEQWDACFISSTSRLVLGARSLEYEDVETKQLKTRTFESNPLLEKIAASVRSSVVRKSTPVFA